MKINKAIIVAAGYGSRFLPLTKSIQKEMLPLLNKPWIDYIVNDCILAGITEIIIVVNEHNDQIQRYYSENTYIYEYLKKLNKLDRYLEIEPIHKKCKFRFVTQTDAMPYGTSTPVKICREYVQNEEAFLVFMGDDYIFNTDEFSEAQKIIDYFNAANASALITVVDVPQDKVNKYGIVEYTQENGVKLLKTLVEKPSIEKAPSTLANISKYVFTPIVFEYFEKQELNKDHKEMIITDILSQLAANSRVCVYQTQGEYMDSGYIEGWLKANLRVACKDHALKASLVNYIQGL